MKRYNQTKAYKEESKLFYGAFCACILIIATYMYFVSMSVMHVVMRKEVDTQISLMGTTISNLEEAYIERQHNLSESIATHKGFVIAEEKIFIDKTEDIFVLSDN